MTRPDARLLMAISIVIALLVSSSPAAAMTFKRVTGGEACAERACILASGEIQEDTGKAFRTFLRRERIAPGALVILDSQGGDVLQALVMGGEIRKAGLSTRVEAGTFGSDAVSGGACASACAYVFLGGVTRSVTEGARLGVHQIFGRYRELSGEDSQMLMALIAVHIQRCGGSMDLMISALRTPPEKMHWLSPSELSRFGVVTGGDAFANAAVDDVTTASGAG